MIVLLLILGLATVASANGNNVSNNCPGNSCHAQGGDGGSATSSATGGQAEGGHALSVAGSSSGSAATSNDAVSIDDHSVYEDSSGELLNHAESAPAASSFSEAAESPCGDATGMSGQTGIVGGGIGTITETCRAYRLQRLQAGEPEALSTKLAAITHFAGWFPRFLLHVASFGVLN